MAIPVPVNHPVLTEQSLAELAYEVARDLKELPDILQPYGISEQDYLDHIETNAWYKRVLEAATIEWASTGSAKQRIKFQAALALEKGIIPLTRELMNSDGDLAKRVEVAKLLTKLAGLDTIGTEGNGGEKFTITINLGADNQVKIEKEIKPAPTLEATAGAGEVFQIGEGTSSKEKVQPVSQEGAG